ncbi:unnamed protein product [Cyprideis torosa]|uniref:Uncharacterized protein n=1 Tax=Cyprideis torosa TaxID=163714 RepID=A0A7R8W7R1_9CRUS|nr:unnamed protein product [Cyprideis torosa]CAG0887827.1 unnamed protein product [Cyprideis torosa]
MGEGWKSLSCLVHPVLALWNVLLLQLRLQAASWSNSKARKKPSSSTPDILAASGIAECSRLERRGVSIIELSKPEETSVGLILTGGEDRPLLIAGFRSGSIVSRCDALAEGDELVAINGEKTASLSQEEVLRLIRDARDRVTLEVEYECPSVPAGRGPRWRKKAIQVRLNKEFGCLGMTIRLGIWNGPARPQESVRPIVITHLRKGGPADRHGSLQPGDRLLAINGVSVSSAKLQQAVEMLNNPSESSVILTVEYNIEILDTTSKSRGPITLELQRSPSTDVGFKLVHSDGPESIPRIESIKQGSLAERCGALHVGDAILSIGESDLRNLPTAEIYRLLSNPLLKLKILPHSTISTSSSSQWVSPFSLMCGLRGELDSPTGTLKRGHRFTWRSGIPEASSPTGFASAATSTTGFPPSAAASPPPSSCASPLSGILGETGSFVIPQSKTHNRGVCRSEKTSLVLHPDFTGTFGFSIAPSTSNASKSRDLDAAPFIDWMAPKGPAASCGVLQVGDKLLRVNGRHFSEFTFEEFSSFIQQTRLRLALEVEFDVADTVVPSSGTFHVKIAKHHPDIGITLSRGAGSSFFISGIRPGSQAHRTGTLATGDLLLAIDNRICADQTLEQVTNALNEQPGLIVLKVKRKPTTAHPVPEHSESGGDRSSKLTPTVAGEMPYTITLPRNGDNLGITITGAEDRHTPVIVSGLSQEGLARKTGVMEVGDHLLAINGKSMIGASLSRAIRVLQQSGENIVLTISKPKSTAKSSGRSTTMSQHTAILSSDSALGSLDSTHEPSFRESIPLSPFLPPRRNLESHHHHRRDKSEIKRKENRSSGSTSSSTGSPRKCSFTEHRIRKPSVAKSQREQESPGSLPRPPDDWDQSTKGSPLQEEHRWDSSSSHKSSSDSEDPSAALFASTGEEAVDAKKWRCTLDEMSCSLGNSPSSSLGSLELDESPPGENQIAEQDPSEDTSPVYRDRSVGRSLNDGDDLQYIEDPPENEVSSNDPWSPQGPNLLSRLPEDLRLSLPQLLFGEEAIEAIPSRFQSLCEGPGRNSYFTGSLPHRGRYRHWRNKQQKLSQVWESRASQDLVDGESVIRWMPDVHAAVEIHRVTLFKDESYGNFGFTISDALCQPGVYISHIRTSGPADQSGVLRPYDRIISVNGKCTVNCDSCLCIPLLSSSKHRLDLAVARNTTHRRILLLLEPRCHCPRSSKGQDSLPRQGNDD